MVQTTKQIRHMSHCVREEKEREERERREREEREKAHVVFLLNFPMAGRECRDAGDILVIGNIPSSHPSQLSGL